MPIIAGYLITRFGWQMSLYALMLPGLAFGLLAAFVLEDSRAAETKQSAEPLDILRGLAGSPSRPP
jgi:hypothetical protein